MATDTEIKYLGPVGTEQIIRYVSDNYVSVAKQTLTEDQKAQARANIGVDNTLVVTIDEEQDQAVTSSDVIHAHVQDGGRAVLIDSDGRYYNYAGGDGSYVSFVLWTDEDSFYTYKIYGDGGYDFVVPSYAQAETVDDKITRPYTAEVGQTIVVKSVDSAGKPISWECVDLPSGGSSTLVVTITGDYASHSSTDIYTHVQNGGTAVLLVGEVCYPLAWCTTYYSEFNSFNGEELVTDAYTINDDRTYEYWSDSLARLSDLPSGGSSTLVVTMIADDAASHTSEEIYDHVQNGGTAVFVYTTGYLSLHKCNEHTAVFISVNDFDNVLTVVDITSQGDIVVREHKARPQTITVTYDPLTGLANSDVQDIDGFINSGLSVILYANNLYYNFVGVDNRGVYASFIHVTQDGRTLRCTVDQGKEVVFYEDTFTEADKTELVNAVLAALPKYNGEVAEV